MRKLIGLGVLAFAPCVAWSQSTTSPIVGEVKGPGGNPLPGVTVTARHLDSGLVRETVAGADGAFTLAALPLGIYEVRAALDGFRPVVQSGIHLELGATVELRLTLDVGAAEDEITVTADVSGVQTRSGELSFLVHEEQIRDLPLNGRNYTDLVFLQPGVIAFPYRDGGSVVAHGLGASINGQDPRSNVYLLDGTLMNDFTNSPAGSAASTALGTEMVHEFRVETNAYSAEYGRNYGGQINVITKSGSNDLHGSAFEYHRNDALDARNYFDGDEKPDFRRNQFGFTLGGPVKKDRTFFFVGYEGLRESLGRNIQTVVPNQAARLGILPAPGQPGGTIQVPVDPGVRPYLDEYPLPNGADLGGGLAAYSFPFSQNIDQDYFQVRLDQNLRRSDQLFVRYTYDNAEQLLPTEFPQFPRTFLSKNQFLTAEYRSSLSSHTLATFRFGYSRTRIGQQVQANTSQPLPSFVPGRESMGDIDVGGIPRFGPQISADVSLRQDVFSLQGDVLLSRGRHTVTSGALVEWYRNDEFNPTFSRGLFAFGNLEGFLRNSPLRFIGLTPEGDLERNWRSTLLGAYVQDQVRLGSNVTLNAGLRLEYATLPEEQGGRDINMPDLLAPETTVGPLYENPGPNLSPRLSLAWDVFGDGRTAVRGGYGLYFNNNVQQNLIVTITNPPFTPRPVIPRPDFPTPDFARGVPLSIRPIQWDIQTPRLHTWNVNVQQALPARMMLTVGYAGSRGRNLLRNSDVNVPVPETLPDGTAFYPPTAARPNSGFSAIELKSSDGESWYDALVVELRRTSVGGLSFQSSYTFSRNIDTTQASTFFSDATNGTVSWMPEFANPNYNRGLADYHARHNWVVNFTWDLPLARESSGVVHALFADWQLAGIGRYRSGPPLTVFVQANRSRSRWFPSLGPGLGPDRPSLVPGRTTEDAVLGTPEQWFDPTAFVLQPAGTVGDTGRGAFEGPDLRVLDLALVKRIRWSTLGPAGLVELRLEAFNVFNRANFSTPSLLAFAGTSDDEAPLPTFGRIRQTATSARQVQLGVRVQF
jgi:hypothetical protein